MPEVYFKISIKSFEHSALQPAIEKIKELCVLVDSREAPTRSMQLTEAATDMPPRGGSMATRAEQGRARQSRGRGGLHSFIPLPSSKKRFTLLRSPHIDKKSREQFQLQTHKAQVETAPCSRDKACLLLLLLKNSEMVGVEVKLAISYSTPFCP